MNIKKDEKKNITEDVKKHRKPCLQLTRETCPAPQMSDPITQTSPDTERGGKQDRVRDKHP